jgi:hypothetical protein
MQERRFTIRSVQVMQAQHCLVKAVSQRLKVAGLSREIAEGQVSRLVCDVWDEIQIELRALPAVMDPSQEPMSGA